MRKIRSHIIVGNTQRPAHKSSSQQVGGSDKPSAQIIDVAILTARRMNRSPALPYSYRHVAAAAAYHYFGLYVS
jgi:hypothetical protein